jgi:hypothetical protein
LFFVPSDDIVEAIRAFGLEQRMAIARMEKMLPTVTLVLDLTPSQASSGKQKKECVQLLNILRMADVPKTLEDKQHVSEFAQENFSFSWRQDGTEDDGYIPLQDHLTRHGFTNTFVVGAGTHLSSSNLFDVNVHELRSKLGSHGEHVIFKARLHGRTDLVCCEAGQPIPGAHILPFMVDFAIEVKTDKSMQGKKQHACELEAMMQVIGLNTCNTIKAPPVVLTNLVKTHSVLYLDRVDEDPLKYIIVKRSCSSILCACDFARTLSQNTNRQGIARDFGRGPTPEASVASTCAADSDDSQDVGNLD